MCDRNISYIPAKCVIDVTCQISCHFQAEDDLTSQLVKHLPTKPQLHLLNMSVLKHTEKDDIHQHLIKEWYKEMTVSSKPYSEPLMEESTVDLIKLCCDSLRLDDHVFIMSTEVLEQYIMVKNGQNTVINDCVLDVVCIIFICSKHVGEQSELRISNVKSFLKRVTCKDYDSVTIKKCEMDILQSLDYKLPLKSKVDDLDTLYMYYVKQLKLKVDIKSLCSELLNLTVISWFQIFYELKRTYSKNVESFEVFQQLVVNNCYMPCSIVLCALHLTNSYHSLNMDKVCLELERLSQIHSDHLQYLANKIYDRTCRQKPA